jgi:asparagine synthase (glutamine-hydrolysing)
MCGINGGVWYSENRRISIEQLDAMTDSQSHRGPDGRGTFIKNYPCGLGIALGHRRLSIIDIAGGAQPQYNENREVSIVFNGEIYNYIELYETLLGLGHRFETKSDTEVIVHLYEEYGLECLQHLRGMFAFAIWDASKRRLFFARDRLGQKPFVYAQDSQSFFFGSEIKALLSVASVPKNFRKDSIAEYLLYGYVPSPYTAFEGIKKLPPGHYGVYEQAKLTVKKYWNPKLQPDKSLQLKDCEEMLRERLRESVQMQLRSDVPLGCFLSGGIDSTVIAGAAQEQLRNPLNTFTIGFGVKGYDESVFAKQVADHLGTNHRCLDVEPGSTDILSRLVWLFDEPFADSSAIPTYFLCQETAKFVKVALTGDGGDENYAGYGRHLTSDRLNFFDNLPRFVRRVVTGSWIDVLSRESRESKVGKLKNRLTVLRRDFADRYVDWVSPFSYQEVSELVNFQGSDSSFENATSYLSSIIRGLPPMRDGTKAMRADMLSYLPGDLLPKVDIVSMAHGLECRSPFLDHLLIEDAMRIPFKFLHQQNFTKPMLSRTFLKWFPDGLANRPKMGFRVPLSFWFRNNGLDGFKNLVSESSFCSNFIDPKRVSAIVELNRQGKWDFGDRIWALQFLEAWGRSHF